MKTVARGISLFLATVLSVGVFAACDSSEKETDKEKEEKIPTIEEIRKIFDESENGKASMSIRSEATESGQTAVMTIDMVMEEDGDVARVVTTSVLTISGEEFSNESQEVYLTKNETTKTTYTKDEVTGKWSSQSEPRNDEEDAAVLGYNVLLDAKYYNEFDKEAGRYTMKDGEKIKSEGVEFTDCYIEYKDGSYTVFAKYTQYLAVCTLTLKYSDIGKVSVTLPEGIEG